MCVLGQPLTSHLKVDTGLSTALSHGNEVLFTTIDKDGIGFPPSAYVAIPLSMSMEVSESSWNPSSSSLKSFGLDDIPSHL